MAGTVSLDLDPIFLKGLGYLHSKSKDSAEKLKALLDESLSRGSDSIYRTSLKEADVSKVSLPKMTKQDSKTSSSSSSSSSSITTSSSKSSSSDKTKKESEKRSLEKIRVDPGEGVEPPKKPRVEKQESHPSPIAFQTKDIPIPDFTDIDETNADDFAMEMGLACVVCRQMTVTSGNQLVECQECHNLYHQECHKPQVTDKDVNDPRLVWYCARCTRQMKRMAQKKPPQKPAPALATAAPMLKDPLVKKAELKPKPETTGSFQAFKRTEVKASSVASGTSSSSNSSLPPGLTGWAAFTKTSNVGPSSTKLSTSQPGSSKSTTPPSGSKPVGLSALANVKPSLATKPSGSGSGGSGNGNNGSSAVPMKPPPPLTLGKQVLSRSTSGDSLGKMTVTGSQSPGAAPSSSLGGNGGTGGNGGGNGASGGNSSSSSNNSNGAKASADGKTPTSQESQLNAMKRLQMVKKKAAQKKLKK
ncbi:LOW QUALITY PROTEIN: integrator complex subunit 12 [Puntigrus tetrazona]|uniref:LOW QUALITY PROTEIN: integrator complex subunit 12 n=1 Tax=Puntigrus tetrazona TaxID=1606681 RepID=UPI001C8A2432|nr:LOW QUALITY PROTEIN: integrator complex subunit 12 [Puntigrus tetrazona]